MSLDLDEARKERLIVEVQNFFRDSMDEDISAFRAEQVLDFAISILGPQIYNQAVQDSRKFIQQRLDDLDGEVYLPESRSR